MNESFNASPVHEAGGLRSIAQEKEQGILERFGNIPGVRAMAVALMAGTSAACTTTSVSYERSSVNGVTTMSSESHGVDAGVNDPSDYCAEVDRLLARGNDRVRQVFTTQDGSNVVIEGVTDGAGKYAMVSITVNGRTLQIDCNLQ